MKEISLAAHLPIITRHLIKKIVAAILSAGLGLLFIYSGYAKLFPYVEPFEMMFVDAGVAGWKAAPLLARSIIGAEFLVGIALIAGFRLRKLTLPLAILMLTGFSAYLLVVLATKGNAENCGCFGDHLFMTPKQALLKNAMMIGFCILAGVLWSGWTTRRDALITIIAAALCLSVPFILNPVDYTYNSNNLEEKVGYPLELGLLYSPADPQKVEIPKVDLRRGKHVVAFLSLTCSHCRQAARKIRIMHERDPSLSFYFVLNGDREMLPFFLADTHADDIPSSFCLGKTFVQLASSRLPRIYYLDNGIVVRKVDYLEMSQDDIERWAED